MKRISLTQLKQILKFGDYVSNDMHTFQIVLDISEDCFTVANHRGEFNYYWNSEVFRTGLYWLPGDLLESTDTIRKIKAARLKERKQWTQEEIDKAKLEAAKVAKELNWTEEQEK